MIKKIKSILIYLHFIVFIKGNYIYYYYTLIIYIIFLLFINIIFAFMFFRLKAGKYDILWPIDILKYCLPAISTTFFGQIFFLLISTFSCRNGKSYMDENVPCRQGKLYEICIPLSVIALIFQIILSFLTVSMYYQPDFISEGNNLLKKRSSNPDIYFLFNKILVIIIFVFDKESKSEHWGILFILCSITGVNAYIIFYYQHFENKIMKIFHCFFSCFLFWGFLSLFISNIFANFGFDGGIYFFVFGAIVITIYCLLYTKTNLEFLFLDFYDIKSSQGFIDYIKYFLKFIKQRDNSRNSSIILTSFIEKIEDGCTNNNCVLKKYLDSLSKGIDSNFLLLQFAQKLFKIALNKFPDDITLRIHYIIFLITEINQKKSAEKELLSIETNIFFINDCFNLYRCKKYIEEYNIISNKSQDGGFEKNDFLQAIEYKNSVKEFIKLLSKSSSLYYDFWSSLYSSHLQGTEDFKKLNDLGAELNIIIERIEKVFEKLREIKNNDLEIIKLYESYLKNILNNKDKYEKYYNISKNLLIDNKSEIRDIDYTNFDLKGLIENDEFKSIIISANNENMGTIIGMSLNVSYMLGYHRHELIGKNMNILIPEIYQKIHEELYFNICEKTKTEFFENLSKKIIYSPKFIEFSSFGRNKSKYLIPLDFKIFFVQTEENDLAYIVGLSNYKKMNFDLYEDNQNNTNQLYCVLTDCNLIIQTFTSNCVELLGLNSNIINSNQDITFFIKHFSEELQSIISNTNREFSGFEGSEMKSNDNSAKDIFNYNNINEKCYEQKLKYKKRLIKMKYSNPRKITWKLYNDKNQNYQFDFGKTQIAVFSPHIYKNKNYLNEIIEYKTNLQKQLIMEVKEAFIAKKQVGYFFYFKKIKEDNNKISFNELAEVKKGSLSPSGKSSLRRPSAKFIHLEESAKSSRLYNNNNSDFNLVLNRCSFSKLNNDFKKKNLNVNFDIDKSNNSRKNESAKNLCSLIGNANIDEKYIPKCSFNFILDIETMSYKPSAKINTLKELYNSLRSQSMEILNIIYKSKKKKKEESSVSSGIENPFQDSNMNSSFNNSNSNSSSESNSSNEKKLSSINNNYAFSRKNKNRKGSLIVQSIISHKKVIINNELLDNENNYKNDDIDEQYYRVNINKIKFMRYDFNQEMVINDTKYEKKSQIDIIIENYKARQNINISEDKNYAHIPFDQYIKDSKNKSKKNLDKFKKKENFKKENIFDKEKEFEKEIIYALSKQDEQKVVIYFYKISFLFLVIILLMGFSEISYIVSHYNKIKENMHLIIYASNLKYFTNFGLYYVRESTLYNSFHNITDGSYKIPDIEYFNYTGKIFEIAKNAFIKCNSYVESIIGSNYQFCKNTSYILSEKPFDIEVLYNNSIIKNITTNFYTSMIQVYSSFCNLLIAFYSISIDNPNLYNFIHNSFNNLGKGLNLQIQLFINELFLRYKDAIIYMIIFCGIYLVLHIMLFFIICRGYTAIVSRKTSYIAVFYGIGLSLIKSSIQKCEFFINKINQNNDNLKIKDFDEETSSIMLTSNNNLNNIFTENDFERRNKIVNNKLRQSVKKRRKLEEKEDKNSKKFRKIYEIFLFISFLYLSIVFYTFLNLTSAFITNGSYIYHMQNYHNTIIELFNSYREYLFDENSVILGLSVYKYVIQKEEDFYSSITENKNFLVQNNRKIKGLYEYYLNLEEKGFCSSYFSYFNSREECENFIGGKEGIMNLGFFTFINSFVEEIRNSRNYMKLLLESKVLVGNLSKVFDNSLKEKLAKNESLVFRLKVFNMDQTHFKLNIIFLNIILQYIDTERDATLNVIEKSMINCHIIYVIFIIIYMIIFLLSFFFYWIPMIRTLNLEIYKTKNMLSIIPAQILASQPNIKELLNISIKSN